jgi:putative molybdopterin biosynthesis protein
MEIMSARDLSKYVKINEKKIYELVRECKVPSMKIGGTIAFVKELIDRWILENTEGEPQLFLAGSDDILLSNVIDAYNSAYDSLRRGIVFYAPVGSINGLKALKAKKATMASVHILNSAKNENDFSYLDKYLGQDDFVVVHLFLREQGIIVQKGNPKGIKSFRHIAEKDATFISRNQGSGTRLLLDYLLNEARIDPMSIKGYEIEADSHLQVGLSVLKGASDAGFGVQYVAHMLGLGFVPLFKERFDLVIPRERYYNSHIKAFLSFIEQCSLIHNARDYKGYDTAKTGEIVYPPAS